MHHFSKTRNPSGNGLGLKAIADIEKLAKKGVSYELRTKYKRVISTHKSLSYAVMGMDDAPVGAKIFMVGKDGTEIAMTMAKSRALSKKLLSGILSLDNNVVDKKYIGNRKSGGGGAFSMYSLNYGTN